MLRFIITKSVFPLVLFAMFACFANAAPRNIAAEPISRMSQGWWRERFEEKQAELHRQPVELLWLGDSITQNWEGSSNDGWRDFAPIWQRFYGDRHAVDLGFKGDSTCHLLWRLQHGELDGISPRVAIVLIGANNFGHIHTDASETLAGVRVILDEIHRRLPGTRVVLLGVLPSIRSEWVSRNTVLLNRQLKVLSGDRTYVTFVDVSDLFLKHDHVDAARFMDPRLVPPAPPLHPTAQTQAQIAERIEPVVARLLGDHIHR